LGATLSLGVVDLGPAFIEEGQFDAVDVQVQRWEERSVTMTDRTEAEGLLVDSMVVLVKASVQVDRSSCCWGITKGGRNHCQMPFISRPQPSNPDGCPVSSRAQQSKSCNG